MLALQHVRFNWPGQPCLLDIPELQIAAGDKLFLQGASGSGKTTLLNLITGIQRPVAGSIEVLGEDIAQMSGGKADRFRADHMGLIFQQFNLLPYLTVTENILLPCGFSKRRRERLLQSAGDAEAGVQQLLEPLGMAGLERRPVADLSIGQQQRVAAARALVGSPSLIIADEPTSALDADSRDGFIRLLTQQCENSNSSLLFVSHDLSLAKHFDRCISLSELNEAAQNPQEVS